MSRQGFLFLGLGIALQSQNARDVLAQGALESGMYSLPLIVGYKVVEVLPLSEGRNALTASLAGWRSQQWWLHYSVDTGHWKDNHPALPEAAAR